MSVSKRRAQPAQPAATNTADQERREYVLQATEDQIDFYQREVVKYAYWYFFLTVVTLVGSAMTPLLILYLDRQGYRANFWIALPSAVAGLAAALNSGFRLREEWAQSYFTLSALRNEKDRFIARASPEYSISRTTLSQAIDNFQNRVSDFVMSEVSIFRRAMTQSSKNEVDIPSRRS